MNKKVLSIVLCIVLVVGFILLGIYIYQEGFSGSIVSTQPIKLGENNSLSSFTIMEAGKNKVLLNIKADCSIYNVKHRSDSGDEYEGKYNYPYTVILKDSSGKVIVNQKGLISSNSGTKYMSSTVVKHPYALGTVVEEYFTAPITTFTNTKDETFNLSVNLEPDSQYKSRLISSEIIVRGNVMTSNKSFLIAGILFIVISAVCLVVIASKGKQSFSGEYNFKKDEAPEQNQI